MTASCRPASGRVKRSGAPAEFIIHPSQGGNLWIPTVPLLGLDFLFEKGEWWF